MKKLQIKKGDTVQVIAGSQKGIKGTVLNVNPKAMKITIQGVNVQTHFSKEDGLKKIEGTIDYSNAKLVEKAAAKKPVAKKAKKSKSATK